jgi:hypothetical protein
MAGACSRLRSEMRGDIHWFVEDDIFMPVQGGGDLFEAMIHGWEPPQAVAGCYRNRHAPGLYVGGHWRNGRPHELTELPAEPFEVDYAGTGCLMYWADQCGTYWESHLNGIPAHDWEWCSRLRARRGRILMLPDVRCGHAVDPRTILPG